MPDLTVSEELYRQIRAESADGDVDRALWRMVGAYRRANNPEADVT